MDSDFINNIKVGDCVDVYRKYIGGHKNWFLMRVEAVNTTSITAADLIDTEDREVIEKSTDYLAPLNTHTVNIVALSSSLKPFTSSVFSYVHGLKYPLNRCPIYDAISNSIISAAYHTAHKHLVIIKYDIALNNTKYLTTINLDENDTYKPYPIRAQTFDPKTRKMFVFLFSDKHELFITVNIDNLESHIEYLENLYISKEEWHSNAVFVPSINKCYLFDNYDHIEIDENGTYPQWIEDVTADWDDTKIGSYFNFLYVESCKKLFKYCNFGMWDFMEQSDDKKLGVGLFYCDLTEKCENICNWHKYEINMDLSMYHIVHVILGFNHILFIFLQTRKYDQLIVALDLRHDKIFYNCSVSYYVSSMSSSYAIKTDTDDIHVIRFCSGVQYKFSLYDIIPNEMTEFYLNKYDPIVAGFIKQTIKQCQLTSYFPDCLRQLILLYSLYSCEHI